MRELLDKINSLLKQKNKDINSAEPQKSGSDGSSAPLQEEDSFKPSDKNFLGTGAIATIAIIPMGLFGVLAVDFMANEEAEEALQGLAQQVAVSVLHPEQMDQGFMEKVRSGSLEKAAETYFLEQVPEGVTITALNIKKVTDENGTRAVVNYEANVDNILGLDILNESYLVNSVESKLDTDAVTNADFYVLVDTSQSMGAGADPATQQKMAADPDMRNCQFACHQALQASQTYVDTIEVAKAKNYPLRIDAVKATLRSTLKSIQDKKTNEGADVRVGIYSFASEFQEIAGPTGNLDDVKKAIDKISLSKFNNGTNLQYALGKLQEKIDAQANPNRKSYIILMSDGVSNSGEVVKAPVTQTNPTGHKFQISPNGTYQATACWDQSPSADQLNAKTAANYALPTGRAKSSRPCVADPSAKNHMGHDMMALMSIDPQWCKAIKDKGYSLATVYTSYATLPMPSPTKKNDWTRNEWRYPFVADYLAPELAQNMQACASSPKDAYVVEDAQSMKQAMNGIVNKWLGPSKAKLIN
ncbi:MAG: VWA domain-containing protein [Alphaproteobacteria bacterium]|nr:VWA domain-containing protein [Alphaproteobacteria bacterium]